MGRCAGTRIKNSSHLLRHGPCRAGARRSEHETGGQLGEDGVWVHNDERFGPAGPELSQQGPEQPIRPTKARSGPLPFEHSKLLAKGRHFEGSVCGCRRTAEPRPGKRGGIRARISPVAHRNPAETRPALCAQAVEFGTSPLLATHSHFSDVPPQFPDPYRRHSQQPRGPGVLDRKIGVR